ncbi:MAG: hypothetical protein II888_06105 [Clostridia bacterium]|nr:hypothetical protein [Clostridia bacterium]
MKKPFRLILFLCFVLLAVFSFTWGIIQLGHRESGYQTIETDDAYGDILFRSGLTLRYWAEGSSAEIRDLTERVSRVYSDSLYANFRLLDPDQTYDGIINLASLNAAPGEVLPISDRLAEVLSNAREKTSANIGYSFLAGPLLREWRTLLYLEDPEPFDPLNNPEEADRLRAITEALQAAGTASLTLSRSDFASSGASVLPQPDDSSSGLPASSSHGASSSAAASQMTACLQVSRELKDLMASLELSAPVLDLGLLHDAYLIDLVAEDLLAAGFDQGVLYSRSGLTRCLRPGETLSVIPDDSHPEHALSAPAPASAVRFSASEKWDQGYGAYTVGETLRHAWIDVRTGMPSVSIPQTALIAPGETAVSVSWQLLRMLFDATSSP